MGQHGRGCSEGQGLRGRYEATDTRCRRSACVQQAGLGQPATSIMPLLAPLDKWGNRGAAKWQTETVGLQGARLDTWGGACCALVQSHPRCALPPVLPAPQSVMLMRLGVAKPLETRKFIVCSRQYLGSTEKEVIELWKSVMVRGGAPGGLGAGIGGWHDGRRPGAGRKGRNAERKAGGREGRRTGSQLPVCGARYLSCAVFHSAEARGALGQLTK